MNGAEARLLAEDISADRDKGFIFALAAKHTFDVALRAEWPEVDTYIIYELTQLVDSGAMSDTTGQRIFQKLYPTLLAISGFAGRAVKHLEGVA